MLRTVLATTALAALAAAPALAATHYMHCYGGGRAGLYFSNVFPVSEDTKGAQVAPAFNAFVQKKYGVMVHTECHRDGTQALAASAKKINEDADQKSRFPSKLIETGWNGR